jgi:SHS2 domain-containing protein
MAGHVRILEEVALSDMAFEATADTLSELCAVAAMAVIETMVDPDTVWPTAERLIERDADDFPSLLFDWLSDIVYLKDADGLVFAKAEAVVTEPGAGRGWHLSGRLRGESIDPSRHTLHADVKAVTKHLYDVRQQGGQWVARVVLDI